VERENTKEILEKYSRKLESQLDTEKVPEIYSKEYERFKNEMIPELTRYEKWANAFGGLIKIKLKEKDRARTQAQLDIAHLDVTAGQSLGLSIVATFGVFFATLLTAVAIFFIKYPRGLASVASNEFSNILLFVFLGVIARA